MFLMPHECSPIKSSFVSLLPSLLLKSPTINVRALEEYRVVIESKALKPATGRPYVRAFSLSGTVPAFTCDCLRFVCAFTPRPKVDLCVSTFSRTMLAYGNNVSFSSSECSTLASCRR